MLNPMLLRLISFPVHGALELALGVAVAASPLAFEFGPAGILAAVLIGTTLIGLALGAAAQGPDRRGISITAHATYDRAFAVALVVAAVLMAIAGESAAVACFAVAALAQSALVATTRYSGGA